MPCMLGCSTHSFTCLASLLNDCCWLSHVGAELRRPLPVLVVECRYSASLCRSAACKMDMSRPPSWPL